MCVWSKFSKKKALIRLWNAHFWWSRAIKFQNFSCSVPTKVAPRKPRFPIQSIIYSPKIEIETSGIFCSLKLGFRKINLIPRVFCVRGARYGETKILVEADDVKFCLRGYGKNLILHASTFTRLSFWIRHVGVYRVCILLRICGSK